MNSLIYAYSWYLDIVHSEWDALVEDDYISVMPITVNRKFGINYLFQPFFAQQLGVFSVNPINTDLVVTFLNAIPDQIKVIDYNLNHFNNVEANDWQVFENTNYLLDLIGDYDKMYAGYSSNTKRNLKKAQKSNLSIIQGTRPEEVVNLFKQNKGAEIEKLTDLHYNRLTRLMYTIIGKGSGRSYGVYTTDNELCAAAFFVQTNNRIIFLFSGSNDKAKDTGAMTCLIDNVIRTNSPRIRILDFEGSNDKGLARFYSGFGAKRSQYLRIKKYNTNLVMKYILRLAGK